MMMLSKIKTEVYIDIGIHLSELEFYYTKIQRTKTQLPSNIDSILQLKVDVGGYFDAMD